MTEAPTAMTRTQPPAAEAKQPTVEASSQPTAEAPSKQSAPERSPQQPAADASPNAGTSLTQAPGSQAAGAPRCDYEACARTHHSFRASDCTYQPFRGGPRRLCEKNPSQQSAATPLAENPAQSFLGELFGKEQCNVDVCARFYSSFDSADCTYRPFGGSRRRVCTR
jgi:hypothetical protein